jgi:DNA-binding HxlR family transcriptional regulator
VEGKWKFAILAQLFATDAVRFSELQRSVGGATHKVLVDQLKQLEKDGIIRRTAYPVVPPKVEYSLTEFGRGLGPVLDALRQWARHAPGSQSDSPSTPDAAVPQPQTVVTLPERGT